MIHIKKVAFYLFFISFLVLCFCKCKPEFSTNADSEPFPVVYGLLNVLDGVHYVKIYKSFLVDGNAYDAVKDIDKYSYKDSIDVYLNEYNDTNKPPIRKIKMNTATSIPKDSGLFLYPLQILYTANAILNVNYRYEIEIINPYTKTIARVKEPIAMARAVTIGKPSGTELTITDRSISFEFYSGEGINRYQLLLKFYYTEDLNVGTSRQPNPIVWEIGSLVDLSGSAGVEKSITVPSGSIFFQKISENIQNNDGVKRRHTDSIVLEVHSAGKDWGLYIQSNLPSSGINQDRLHYSNIIAYNMETNEPKYATGVFSSRSVTSKKYKDLVLVNGSRDSLFNGRFTGHLLFTDNY